MKKLTCLMACLGCFAQLTYAQPLSIERIHSSPSLDGSAPKSLKVSPDGKRITFLKGKKSDYERMDLWEYHIDSGKTQLLFDSNTLHAGPEVLSDEEKARRERMRVYGTGIMSYHWSEDGKSLLFPLGGDAFYFRLGDKKARQLLQTPEFETDIRLSPKGDYISYIRKQNLYVKHIATGKETPITTDGQGSIKNGMAEFVAQEEMDRMTGYWWSPDGSQIAYTRIDESPVEQITRSEIYAESIKLIQQRYPSTGTPNATIQLAVTSVADGATQWVDLGKDKDIYLPRVKWFQDSQHLSFQWQSRDQQQLKLQSFNTQTGKQHTLLTENSNTWLNLHHDLIFLKDGKHFIWASEKDGFKHLYLHKLDGSLVTQITKGAWVVDEVQAIDENQQLLYFTGRADTPIEKHLYKVPLTGGDIQRVSQRQGFHEISFSQDASVYVDTFSTINNPAQVSLHTANGQQLAWLEQNQLAQGHPLYPYSKSWIKPKFGTIKTQDGVSLHYRMYTPEKLEGQHPAIVFLYGGPHAQMVTNKWAGKRGLLFQHWTNKGYVVFTLDNRGSNYRGKAFEDPIYQDMGNVEVQDQVAGVKFLHSLPYVDKQRVGIYGHSYGGYMALMAMFKAGDYFQAGVSGAPVTDWLLYDTHYTERYMGHPAKTAEAYTNSSVFPYAKDLTGDLLIYHGMADDNVLFTHSTKLYKHLQDLALPFETMDYPGKKHSIRGKQTGIHLYHTITNFFDRSIGQK